MVQSKALAHFRRNIPGHVDAGCVEVIRLENGRLFTFGVATCAVLVIHGTADGKPVTLLQHLSGHNFQGQPMAHVNRDLGRLLGEKFSFVSGCIIPGGFLDCELISSTVDPDDPTMQLLLWEQLKTYPWRDRLELWTHFRATHKLEVTTLGEVRVFADDARERQNPGRSSKAPTK